MLHLSIRLLIFEVYLRSLMDTLGRLWYRTTFEIYTVLLEEHSFCTGVIFDAELSLLLSCLRSSCTLPLTMLYWYKSQYVGKKGVFCQR